MKKEIGFESLTLGFIPENSLSQRVYSDGYFHSDIKY